MSTTTSTDWKARALAAHESRQAALRAEERRQEARLAVELGAALDALGIQCEPDSHPYTLDGVTFRMAQYEEWEPPCLQIRRVCAICGDVPGAVCWDWVPDLVSLGRALAEPWHCQDYRAHRQLQAESAVAADPASTLVTALRAFIAAERGETDG